MLPSEEYTEVEGRAYVNPQVSLDETTDFIQNLRDTQTQNTQQITVDTRNLGTEVPSNLGGLTGAESYFTSRYQTPQTNALVADLRSTAQAKALNDALANEQAMWKKRYNDAYRAYQKSQYDKTYGGGGGGGDDTTTDETTLDIGSVTTDAIAKSMYLKKFQEYIKQGMTAAEAEARAKEDLGINEKSSSNSGGNTNLQKQKSTIGGDNAYVYTLPSGKTVLVDESKYELIETSTGYVLRDLTSGKTTEVGY